MTKTTHPFTGTRRPSKARIDKAFQPYAIEIGHLTRAWNKLQENLCMIFAQIISPRAPHLGWAAWHSLTNDRAQRHMLESLLPSLQYAVKNVDQSVKGDIKWLLEKTDKLANRRNTAIHAPLYVGLDVRTKTMIVDADWFMNHPLSVSIKGQNILDDLAWYRAEADALKDFAVLIWMRLRETAGPWPGRPQLPTRGQIQVRRAKPYKNSSNPL